MFVVIVLALLILGNDAQQCSDTRDTPPVLNCGSSYDFIVVGAGTAGSIVASRLANANENYQVLLIESGSKVYENATRSLELLFPILFGIPLEDIQTVVGALQQILDDVTNPIPLDADISWLASKLDSTLSSLSPGMITRDKRVGILGELLTGVAGIVTTTTTTTTAGSTSPPTSPPGARQLLQYLVNAILSGVASLIPNIQETPLLSPYVSLSEGSHYFSTTPQIFSQKREIDYPRGKLVGGSSGSNQMVFFRGSKRDFDIWEAEYGLEGWEYEEVLQYFKAYENNQDIPDTTIHGHSGPINITLTKNQFDIPSAKAFVDAAKSRGWSEFSDASDPTTTYGVSYWQTFVGDNGRRSDSSAYIKLMDKKRKVCWNKPKAECSPSQTLHVWTDTTVTKVLFEGNRAVGVEYLKGVQPQDRSESPYYPKSKNEGSKHHTQFNKWDRTFVQESAERLGCPAAKSLAFDLNRPAEQYVPLKATKYTPLQVKACREVILSAGSVASAQLLMLSGIGPEEGLKARSIPVLADINVGTHTQDHQELALMYKMPIGFNPGFTIPTEILQGFPQFRNFFEGRRGFLSSNNIAAGLDGSSAGPYAPSGTPPSYHLHFLTIGAFENFDFNIAAYHETESPLYRLPRNIVEFVLFNNVYIHQLLCELSDNHAFGTIELRSSDPFVPPFVDPRFGSSDEDNRNLVECLKEAREVVNRMEPRYRGQELPPSVFAQTDEQLLQVVVTNVWGHHISGSAPMGNCSNPFAVTDGKGRVHKVDGLRVIDASLFPTIPHANPAGVVMMIAEKLAHDLWRDHYKLGGGTNVAYMNQWPSVPL